MKDTRRDQLIEVVEREFIGPDPINWPGLTQENGEEIIKSINPENRYLAGVLFPLETKDEDIETEIEEEILEFTEEVIEVDNDDSKEVETIESIEEILEDAEELINRSNAYNQSAISLTASVYNNDEIMVKVKAGRYKGIKKKDADTNKEVKEYHRTQIYWDNDGLILKLPKEEVIQKIPVANTGLQFIITARYSEKDYTIYTFTLENDIRKTGSGIKSEECFFQVGFTIQSKVGFCPMPDSQKINKDDEDFKSNQLLYRDIKNYAIGHGCAADWDYSQKIVTEISSTIFPIYELKPIVPEAIQGVSLDMQKMSDNSQGIETITELNMLCIKYEEWIVNIERKSKGLDDKFKEAAERHVNNCKKCLKRMRNGISLLENNDEVLLAFQLMNRVMLTQQLHYNLPLQKWRFDENGIRLENPIERLPVIEDRSSWYLADSKVYGKWRPFQLAFILMNLHSMYHNNHKERQIVDLIWFPTGGGKTEAYLGLSAYTIFIDRILGKSSKNTLIMMRYTLRLLTAQQYERAAAMICACEMVRIEKPNLLGKERITIGLWVGGSTTPNNMRDAVKAYDDLYNKKTDVNPFVMLKCPWCGAQMGVVDKDGKGKGSTRRLQGYKKKIGPHSKKEIVFQCDNSDNNCLFSKSNFPLPLFVVDDAIYDNPPTLLLGTVDKFAMLPYRPQAQSLFGYDENGIKKSSPALIIQDELHLISGPLGSMVGHYETLIQELCALHIDGEKIYPKIVASTATISRAKEQCHALYGCGEENVFQFPPSGIDSGDSFFAKEDKNQAGRKYVGIFVAGLTSDTTKAIRLYSSILFGAKHIKVKSEEERDPYWTNVGYYNSIRELGQAATWIRADIEQHLDLMYKRRFDHKRYRDEEYKKKRRYIYRDAELTSRIRSDQVTSSLADLSISYTGEDYKQKLYGEFPIDICLATNMISVGLDVQRLGLMTMSGQPKTTSEYIQATSRVGRNSTDAPGVIFVLYRPGRPRDRSHYEHFIPYHSRIYSNVEPTSVTPFSSPVRQRALHAIMIGLMRLEGDEKFNDDPPRMPDDERLNQVKDIIKNRIEKIDEEELESAIFQMKTILQNWEDWQPQKWVPEYTRDWAFGDSSPLIYPSGSPRNEAWGKYTGMATPTSMRNVDAQCEVDALENRYYGRRED